MELDIIDAIVAHDVYVYAALAKRGGQSKYVRRVLSAGQQRKFPGCPMSLAALGLGRSRFFFFYFQHINACCAARRSRRTVYAPIPGPVACGSRSYSCGLRANARSQSARLRSE